MKFTIDIPESEMMSTEDVMKGIADRYEYKYTKDFADPTGCRFLIVDASGDKGTIDVSTGEIEWENGEYEELYDGSRGYYSIAEFLDTATALWMQDEDGVYYLYTE